MKMVNKRKQKRRLKKSLNRRYKEIYKLKIEKDWRNIFVKAGVLVE